MKVLSFDQATTIGYCLLEGDMDFDPPLIDLIDYGSVTTKKKKTIDKLLDLKSIVNNLMDKHCPEVIVCEEIYMGKSVTTFKFLSALLFIIQELAITKNIPYYIYSPGQARSFFDLDNFGEIKKEVLNWAKEFYECDNLTFDIADSMLLGTYHLWNKKIED